MSKNTEAVREEKGSIANLDELEKEFKTGKMLPRKSIMLKARLLELYTTGALTPRESSLMEIILKKDRNRGTLSDKDTQFLNRIEKKECVETCRCINDDNASVLFIKKDRLYKFKRDYDNDRFLVYVDYEVPPSHQMTLDLVTKEARGHFANESEYPKERTDIRVLNLNEKFFDYYFALETDLLSEKTEENYLF